VLHRSVKGVGGLADLDGGISGDNYVSDVRHGVSPLEGFGLLRRYCLGPFRRRQKIGAVKAFS
jgi:hypothetical protein